MAEAVLQPLAQLMAEGGFVMPPLALGCIILWYAIGSRAYTLRRGDRRSIRALLAEAEADRLTPRGVIDGAAQLGARLAAEETGEAGETGSLARRLDEGFGLLRLELGRHGAIIRAIVFAAPLTGLLGTVAGMIEVFDSLGSMSLFSQSGGIAGGVAQALLTTQMGLAVAIPGTIIGRLLSRRQQSLEEELDELKELLLLKEGRACAA